MDKNQTASTETDQPKVYVASGLSNWKRARSICSKLKLLGIQITYDWNQWGEQIFGDGTEINPSGIKPEHELLEVALDEVRGVENANVVLAIMPGERGTHFEMAIAWHASIPIVMLTDGETAARPTTFHYLPGIERISDEQQAIEKTAEMAKALHAAQQSMTIV